MADKQYRWNAEDYARHSTAQLEWANELITKLGLKGHESLLDVGCGDGKITAALASRLPQGSVLGIDSSPDMIDLAHRLHGENGPPNLAFDVMNAREIHCRGPFDVAFSNAALHWVIDQRAFLRALKGCMKPGGRILFQMGGKGNALDVFVAMFRLIRSEPWSRWFEGFDMPYSFLDEATYRDLLVEAGFEPVRVELIPRDMAQDGAEGLESWVRTTWLPFKDRLPEELWQPLVHALVSDYIETHPLDAAGKSHVTMIRLEVEAVNPE